MKQDCIKITAVILLPFSPDVFGDTDRAEKLAQKIQNDMEQCATIDKWLAKKCRVEAE